MTGTRADESATRDAEGRAAVSEALERPDARNPLRALAEGELGSVRVLIALALIWAIFQIKVKGGIYLDPQNLTNLSLQIAAVGTVSIGIVLILLLGEIDLSVGSVAGLCASIAAVLSVKNGWDPKLAIVAAILAGTAIGLFHGLIVTFFGIPSFVVTLAGLIAWQGAQLKVLGATGTVNLPTPGTITDLANTYYSKSVGWIIALVTIGAYVASALYGRRSRIAAGLEPGDIRLFIGRMVVVAAAILLTIGLVFNRHRGVPLSPLIFVSLVAIFAFITERTLFGRHIFAVGGNEEAARRAGIKTMRIKVAVFMLASALAAVGGILLAARNLSVGQSTPSSDFLLLAIAGPVVAGVSLFGGRGTVWAALLGGLVMGSISNGMDLLALQAADKFMITGGVLLAAVVLDAATSRRRKAVTR
ncbi:MAG: D-xylose transport system permease protein [Thermoleophilales bacterium]|nr:D-xylose transport system permease protein [Thermoleophilales bacterium]